MRGGVNFLDDFCDALFQRENTKVFVKCDLGNVEDM